MSDENEFEPRHSAQTTLLFPCQGKEECPPGSSTSFIVPCPGYIVGQVTDARTGNSLEGISVWINSSQTGSYMTTVTNGLGYYKVGPLEIADDYLLVVRGEGWSRTLVADISITETGRVQNVVVQRTGVVSGQVLDSNGQSVSGATVILAQQDAPFWGYGSALSDHDGKYWVCSLDIGPDPQSLNTTYSLLVAHPEKSASSTQGIVSPCYGPGEEATALTTLNERATIQGQLGSSSGPDVQVSLAQGVTGLFLDPTSQLVPRGGTYSFSVDAPGTYALTFNSAGTSFQAQVSVSPGSTRFAPAITFPMPGTLTGTISDLDGNALSGIVVSASDQTEDEFLGNDVTTSTGSYLISDLPSEVNLVVRAENPNRAWASSLPRQENVMLTTSDSTTVNLAVNTGIPTCQIVAPSSGATLADGDEIQVQTSDIQGIQRIYLTVNDDETTLGTQTYTAPYPASTIASIPCQLDGLSDGEIQVRPIVVNTAGTQSLGVAVTFSIGSS